MGKARCIQIQVTDPSSQYVNNHASISKLVRDGSTRGLRIMIGLFCETKSDDIKLYNADLINFQ